MSPHFCLLKMKYQEVFLKQAKVRLFGFELIVIYTENKFLMEFLMPGLPAHSFKIEV